MVPQSSRRERGTAPRRTPVPAGATAERDAVAVLDALRRVVRLLRLSSRALEKKHGLSGAQLFVLQQLAGTRVSSVADLAERTVTDQSSVSVVVRRLVEKGLVQRSPSKTDARSVELRLTGAGRTVLANAPRPAQERLVEGIRSLAPVELRGLALGLERLSAALGVNLEDPVMFFEDARATRSDEHEPEGTASRQAF